MNRSVASKTVLSLIIGAIVFMSFAGMAALYVENKKDKEKTEGMSYYEWLFTSTSASSSNTGSSENDGNYITREYDGLYKVVEVIDGDTFKVQYGEEVKSVRLIGVNTPETVDSRTGVECYGKEASDYLKNKINGKDIYLAKDSSQDNQDKYGRLLRYAMIDGIELGVDLIANGYAREYTYDDDYFYIDTYHTAEESAKTNKLGIWSDKCQDNNQAQSTDSSSENVSVEKQNCVIKGNISNYGGTKIYHVPGQKYYESTQIDESAGERWFCTEAEAQAAGWRKSKE